MNQYQVVSQKESKLVRQLQYLFQGKVSHFRSYLRDISGLPLDCQMDIYDRPCWYIFVPLSITIIAIKRDIVKSGGYKIYTLLKSGYFIIVLKFKNEHRSIYVVLIDRLIDRRKNKLIFLYLSSSITEVGGIDD